MARLGLTGMHALPVNRRWVDIHRRPMPLKNLDPAMEGLKIVQISDLHYSPVVWQRYLIQYLRWVNELEPDLVVVTGDLITGGYRFAHRVATMLSHLKARAWRDLHVRQSRLQHLREARQRRRQTPGGLSGIMSEKARADCFAESISGGEVRWREDAAGYRRAG